MQTEYFVDGIWCSELTFLNIIEKLKAEHPESESPYEISERESNGRLCKDLYVKLNKVEKR